MKVGRNEPCPCGSGLKAKRCCLAEPAMQTVTPRALLARMQKNVASALAGFDRAEFRELYDEMIYLPELDVSLQVRLPGVHTPATQVAMDALGDADHDRFDEALRLVLDELDTPERRLELAQAILASRDHGVVPPPLAAVAIFDLNQPDSGFLLSSLAQALAVASGDEETPSGLLVATR